VRTKGEGVDCQGVSSQSTPRLAASLHDPWRRSDLRHTWPGSCPSTVGDGNIHTGVEDVSPGFSGLTKECI
jgi:hypothetical protein